ncbi:hypothetical protein ACFX16_012096 [Malus domestica]
MSWTASCNPFTWISPPSEADNLSTPLLCNGVAAVTAALSPLLITALTDPCPLTRNVGLPRPGDPPVNGGG